MPFAIPDSRRAFLADCSLSCKLAFARLPGRPIAAQYGGYALSARPEFDGRAARNDRSRKLMIIQRWVAFALAAALLGAAAGQAAELPSQRGQTHKPSRPRRPRPAISPALPACSSVNGVCVRFSGYVSSQFSAGQLR